MFVTYSFTWNKNNAVFPQRHTFLRVGLYKRQDCFLVVINPFMLPSRFFASKSKILGPVSVYLYVYM